jgi:hypothetical protein
MKVNVWVEGGGTVEFPSVHLVKTGFHNDLKTGEKHIFVLLDERESVYNVVLLNVSEGF